MGILEKIKKEIWGEEKDEKKNEENKEEKN